MPTLFLTPRKTDDAQALWRAAVQLGWRIERLTRWEIPDVGVIPTRGWAVVEQNAAWGSGIYGCDPAAVLNVLRYSVTRLNH